MLLVPLVRSEARFSGIVTANDVTVTGFSTIAGNYNINNSSGQITAGIITSTNLHVGTGGTIITTQVGFGSVGIGSTNPESGLDINVAARFKSYSEQVSAPSVSSNQVTIDLSAAQTFTVTADNDVTEFIVNNPPSGSTTFTIKIVQDSTGNRSVGIDTFKDSGGNTIPVYWARWSCSSSHSWRWKI